MKLSLALTAIAVTFVALVGSASASSIVTVDATVTSPAGSHTAPKPPQQGSSLEYAYVSCSSSHSAQIQNAAHNATIHLSYTFTPTAGTAITFNSDIQTDQYGFYRVTQTATGSRYLPVNSDTSFSASSQATFTGEGSDSYTDTVWYRVPTS